MKNGYITISEAIASSKVSESTVRRWIFKYSNNKNIAFKDNGNFYINSEFFFKDYPKFSDYSDDQHKQSKELAEFTLEKQQQDIFKELIKQRKDKSFLPFWITIGFVCLIFILGSLSYYIFKEYKAEVVSNYEKLISDKETLIQSKNKDIAEIKEQYQSVLTEVKSSYQKLTFEQERQINELSKKLEAVETAFKNKNLPLQADTALEIKELGQGADNEKGRITKL
jgi:flagellar motility protein MotE (MotC chaperone)